MGATPRRAALHQDHPDIVIVEVGKWREDTAAVYRVVMIGFSGRHLAPVHAALPVLRFAPAGTNQEKGSSVLPHDVPQQLAGRPNFHPVRAPPKIPCGRDVASPYHTDPECLVDGWCGDTNVDGHFLCRGGVSDHFERFSHMSNDEWRLNESVVADDQDGSVTPLCRQRHHGFPNHLQEKGRVFPSGIGNNPGMAVLSPVLASKRVRNLVEARR